jgi:hypothetical protein
MNMNGAIDGVRGEVKEYSWGKIWWDGTKEFNNGVIQYFDGTLEFDGLTFYPNGVVTDATGEQVGLALEEQDAGAEDDPLGDVVVEDQVTVAEDAEFFEQAEVEGATNQTDRSEVGALIAEEESDAESYFLPAIDDR